MSIVVRKEQAVAESGEPIFKAPAIPARKRKVLDEDTFVEKLDAIIQRDFFPDLNKLRAQKEYLEARDQNNVEKLRQLHLKYGMRRANTNTPDIYSTPSTFETPIDTRPTRSDKTPGFEGAATPDRGSRNAEDVPEEDKDAGLTVDQYLAKYTSEDNVAFEQIIDEAELKHRQQLQNAWLFEQEQKLRILQAQKMLLPGMEQQAIAESSPSVDTWTYKSKNAVMYYPEGAPLSERELFEASRKVREVIHPNTRLTEDPFELGRQQLLLQKAAAENHLLSQRQGKVGVDGREVTAEKGEMGGFSFMATPSPAPGVDASPFLTWGEIEGTPFRLDGGDTPLRATPGPSFRISEPTDRERIGLALAEKASASHRGRKEEALKRMQAAMASPRMGLSRMERLSSMSPAAQRLASTRLAVRTATDRTLRDSYSPAHAKGPLVTTPLRTPTRTPQSGRKSARDITDNLLQIPHRSKASDFFDV